MTTQLQEVQAVIKQSNFFTLLTALKLAFEALENEIESGRKARKSGGSITSSLQASLIPSFSIDGEYVKYSDIINSAAASVEDLSLKASQNPKLGKFPVLKSDSIRAILNYFVTSINLEEGDKAESLKTPQVTIKHSENSVKYLGEHNWIHVWSSDYADNNPDAPTIVSKNDIKKVLTRLEAVEDLSKQLVLSINSGAAQLFDKTIDALKTIDTAHQESTKVHDLTEKTQSKSFVTKYLAEAAKKAGVMSMDKRK